jgi:protein-S-isoprenylcysteine O-methyltransferase Ste14
MKAYHAIDLHKVLTAPVVLAMMFGYGNFSVAAWTYLALHGSYGLMWRYKSSAFPDRQWNEPVSTGYGIQLFVGLGLYWVAPWLLISSGAEAPGWIIGLSVTLCAFGTLLHYGADAQKHFVLRARPGLITDGFFARTRNPNYLGEILLYAGFATLSMHWAPWLINAFYWVVVFVPNMRKKDLSMSRYPEWDAYVARTGLLLPKLGSRAALEDPAPTSPSQAQ